MKKIIVLALTLISLVTLAGCSSLFNTDNTTNEFDEIEQTHSLAILGFLSEGFLATEDVSMDNSMFLSFVAEEPEEDMEIDEEMEVVNIYLDKLKVFMESGSNPVASLTEDISDKEGYDNMITFTINEELYVIYYQQDLETLEFTGLLVFGENEYELEGFSSFEYQERVREHEGDDELDEPNDVNPNHVDEDGEIEDKMVLVATNGEDTIKITFKKEESETESVMKLRVESTIDQVEKDQSIRIYEEENQYKVRITEGSNSFMFKKEVGEDNTKYMLNYHVDGVNGVARIRETINEAGEVEYDYFINEGGKDKVITKRPGGRGRRNSL